MSAWIKEHVLNNKIAISAIKYMALFLVAFMFLLVFSLWTSPLYKNWYGCDASFFTMAGRAILNGYVPYRDFFDLKGPYFFFIEALGQLLVKGRTGAFIIQVFALFFALILMVKTCRLFLSCKKTAVIVSLFLFFHAATLWGGNTLEEFILPLNLLAIYLTVKDIKGNASIRPLTAIITGGCFGIILFAKVTVAAPIIGLVIAIIIYFIRSKRIFELISYLIYAFFGVLVAITPVFIYFYCHKTLTDMLYAVFVFAFKRSLEGDKYDIHNELKISGCYFAIIFALCQIDYKRVVLKLRGLLNRKSHSETSVLSRMASACDDKCECIEKDSVENKCEIQVENTDNVNASVEIENKFALRQLISETTREFVLSAIFAMGFITAITLHFGDPFIYYFTTVYPIFMLTMIAMFVLYNPLTLLKSWRLDIPVIAFLVFMCYFASHTSNQLNTVLFDRGNTYYQTYVDKANEMASLIPDCDRDSVYSINMDMQWFECNNILPCYSYTINLQFFVALDNQIEQNIINRLTSDPPKWIVIGGDLSSYLPNINDVVMPMYSEVYENEYGALYLLD